MKKIVGTIAAVAVAAGVAFADVGIGSWGRAIFSPVGTLDGGKTFVSNETTSWMGGKGTSRMGFSVHGESENVGFNVDLKADRYSVLGINDTAFFWAKPWEFLEVKIGKVQDDTGRGNLCYGMFNWWRMGFGGTGEDLTFTRFGNGGGAQANGAIVKITPIEGLWIIGAFNLNDTVSNTVEATKVFGNQSQYGVGYNINGVGSVRAQYIARANGTDIKGNTIGNSCAEVAFDLTAVDGLYVTVGAQIPFGFNAVGTGNIPSNEIKIAAGADFKLAAVTLHAIVDVRLPNTVTGSYVIPVINKSVETKYTRGGRIGVGVGADVDFGNAIGLVADIRFQSAQDGIAESTFDGNTTTSTSVLEGKDSTLSFLVGLSKGLTNGSIGVGFEGEIQKITTSDSQFNWAIPVVISASF